MNTKIYYINFFLDAIMAVLTLSLYILRGKDQYLDMTFIFLVLWIVNEVWFKYQKDDPKKGD